MPAQADIPNFFYQRKQKNDSDIIQDYKVEVEVDIISCIYVVLIKSSDCVTDSNHTVDIERLDINIYKWNILQKDSPLNSTISNSPQYGH